MDLHRVARYAPRAVRESDARAAAVLAMVIDRPSGPHLLFTKRADHLGEHPGQMAFPGGGRESWDDTLEATALREADEEIGVGAGEVEVVGRLDDIRTVTDYAVTPFVSRAPDRAYTPDEREVAEVVVLPVAAFTDPGNYRAARREHPEYGPAIVHYFEVDGYTVWGATGRILVQLLELTTRWERPSGVDRVVGPDELP
ncbi:MAG: CoA pyrophosphatase [Halobacteriaceae archaeon]